MVKEIIGFVRGILMAICLIIVAALTAQFQSSWSTHQGAAWPAAAFIWIYVTSFGFSWVRVILSFLAQILTAMLYRGPVAGS